MRRALLCLLAGACGAAPVRPQPGTTAPKLTPQVSGSKFRLQAVSAVDRRTAWVSGLGGTYAITTDGGVTWNAAVVPGAERLEFRDVQARSATSATLLASGPGPTSRIYRTDDGGSTWELLDQNHDPNGFYDCLATFSDGRSLVMTDSIGGRFIVLESADGKKWTDIGDRLPAAQPNEAAFAASGTCVATYGARMAWIVTGGALQARVVYTVDAGATWKLAAGAIAGSQTSGATSVAFRDAEHGVMGGGDIRKLDVPAQNFARSSDGGKSWQLGTPTPFAGPIFGLAYGGEAPLVVATGPGGSAYSADEGQTWSRVEGAKDFWAVGFAGGRRAWLVGTDGRIVRIDW